MKKSLITILVTMLITSIAVLTIFEIIAQNKQLEADVLETIDSEILEEQRNLLIHLPTQFDPSKTYPVMYVLDGSSQDFRIAGIAEILSRAGVINDMIIIGIPNTDRNRDLTPHYIFQKTDGERLGEGDQFLKFLVNEVIPFIESQYPTNGYRMLAGHSRGGLFTFYAYLEQPEVFDALFCFSPSFWRDNTIIFEKSQQFYSADREEHPFIYMSLGTEENEKMKRSFDEVTKFLDQRIPDNFIHSYTHGANHGNNLYYSTPGALKKWNEFNKGR
ncbi:alpha/beta hydrolase [Ekhidna sp.]